MPTAPCQIGQAQLGQAVIGRERGLHRPAKEFSQRNAALAGDRDGAHLGVERERGKANLRGGIGIGETAADGAAIARLHMADEAQRLGEKRRRRAQLVVRERRGLARAGADGERAVAQRDEIERGDAVDVEEQRRPRQPHREERHQRLSAGDDLRVAL